MDANTYSLKQILTQDRRYIVPTFQRDYEWTKDGQWELLFDDLEQTADRLHQARVDAAATGASPARAEQKVAPHFLGAIVCDQLTAPAGGIDLRAVIDGQQRLTTVQLLLRGVVDVLISTGSHRERQLRRLMENPSDVVANPHDRYKLWPRRRDREVWPQAMDDAPAPPEGSHLYLQARRYFADRARNAIVGPDGGDRIDVLVDALLDLFKIVVIDLEDNDDAQVIFEVLNGRQTPLSAADLVKNLLFLRGELSDERELERVYDQYWAPFDDDWWKVNVGRGHAQRGRRDLLLSSWLTAVSQSEANISHLYSEVRTYVDHAERKTVDVLAELADFGRAYRVVVGADPAGSLALARSYRRIDRLGITTAVPLLLWMRTLPSTQLTLAEHERAVGAVESWIVRRVLVGANTRGYGKVFVDVLKAASAAADNPGSSIADAVVRVLASNPDKIPWPTDEELVTAFTTRRIYNNVTQDRIRLVLGAIDEHLQEINPRTEPATFHYDQLQIEHVMPQAWREHWPLTTTDDADRLLEDQERDQAVHRFGNLTLVTSAFNGAVSHFGWAVKRPEFTHQSSLQLNRPIAGRETWDVTAIVERGQALAAVAARVWPRQTVRLGVGE
ncbi:protein of unknown function DUF1524 RloF [Alloactinosynnema sp. L-07]|uniref:DUF262 domain-containing protein n=1 Tax=Alloactinosynnema sp. L-07 TaxID=1653480 RepID=UPI00065F0435|nr:DUF262 domain-containing protein [Alloactinosynnema sp. L-07]CRK59268.1 protein of unknown function DUF1524 RloF [Alloactinosynnema sp. L-07]